MGRRGDGGVNEVVVREEECGRKAKTAKPYVLFQDGEDWAMLTLGTLVLDLLVWCQRMDCSGAKLCWQKIRVPCE
jgi:hypothetical protein